jgi:hypothetical protein
MQCDDGARGRWSAGKSCVVIMGCTDRRLLIVRMPLTPALRCDLFLGTHICLFLTLFLPYMCSTHKIACSYLRCEHTHMVDMSARDRIPKCSVQADGWLAYAAGGLGRCPDALATGIAPWNPKRMGWSPAQRACCVGRALAFVRWFAYAAGGLGRCPRHPRHGHCPLEPQNEAITTQAPGADGSGMLSHDYGPIGSAYRSHELVH